MVFEKTYIYFDTNSLESRFSNSLFLSKFSLNHFYYEVEKMVRDLGLEKKVHLCISEIVLMEMLEHLKITNISGKEYWMKQDLILKQIAFLKELVMLANVKKDIDLI